jgi:hypothetical protein
MRSGRGTSSPMAGSRVRRFMSRIGVAARRSMLRPLVAHCHLGLGKLYRRTGDQAKTEEHLVTATTIYREMGMSFWLEKAEAVVGPLHGNSP